MTLIFLLLFTAALFGVLFWRKKHEMVLANSMNTLLMIALAVAFGLKMNTGGLFYLIIILYYVIPMYGVIALFGTMKRSQAKKQDSYT